MCKRPACPGTKSTKIPKSAIRATVPLKNSPAVICPAITLTQLIAFSISASGPPKILTRPLSSISMVVLVLSIISLITLPPPPITAPILSGLICIEIIFGTNGESSGRGSFITFCSSSRICKRP